MMHCAQVCVYFNNKLLRGNRAVKTDNSALAAFDSPNMQPLARMNINIKGKQAYKLQSYQTFMNLYLDATRVHIEKKTSNLNGIQN